MKRVLTLFLACVLMLSLFASCGNTPESTISAEAVSEAVSVELPAEPADAAQEGEAPPAEEEISAVEEPVIESAAEEIPEEPLSMDYEVSMPICEEPRSYSMWMDVSPVVASYAKSADDMVLYGMIEEMTGISFDLTIINGIEAGTQFPLMIAAEDYTDIISHMNYYSTGVSGALSDDVIVDIYDDVVEYAPHYWAYISENPECLATLVTNDGKMGALCTTVQETGLESEGLVIHGEWLEELNMDTPTTYEELYTFGKTCLDTYGAAFCLTSDGNCPLFSMGLGVLAGEYMVLDEQVQHYIQVPGYYDYLRLMADWYAEGVIYKDFYTLTDISANGDLFCKGQCSLNQLNANIMTMLYEKVEADSNTQFIGIPSPVTEKGGQLPCSLEVSSIRDAATWCISSSCDPEGIPYLMQLVDYMYSDEGALLYNYGVEGESFEFNAEGKPTYTELVTASPEGYSVPVAINRYATINVPSRLDATKDCYAFNEASWDAMELFASQHDGTGSFPSAAKQSLTAEEMESFAAISGDVDTYVNAEILKFITGAEELTEESYDAFVQNAISMGLEDMVDLYQTGYERYLEKIL